MNFTLSLRDKLVNLGQLHTELMGMPGFMGLSRVGKNAVTINLQAGTAWDAEHIRQFYDILRDHDPEPENGWTDEDFERADKIKPKTWPPPVVSPEAIEKEKLLGLIADGKIQSALEFIVNKLWR